MFLNISKEAAAGDMRTIGSDSRVSAVAWAVLTASASDLAKIKRGS